MSSTSVVVATLLVIGLPLQSHAFFHLSQIDEAMSGVGGDPNTQYVEIRMLSTMENSVQNARLTFFGCNAGNPATVLKLLDKNVAVGMAGGDWIMATTDPVGGIHPDFIISPGIDPSCGMICWGAPVDPMTFKPPADPTSWSATDPANYVDCWAYGGYSGPIKVDGTETSAGPAGDGTMSLTRSGTSLALACPTPTNDAGDMGAFAGACATSTTTTLPGGASQCADAQAAASTRAMIAAECPCASAMGHRAYAKCAAGVVSKAVKAGMLLKSCKGSLKRCAVQSTCGRPGFVTCCRTTAKGAQKCTVKKGAAACKSPKGGTACVGSEASCCDACGGATCPLSATTTTTTQRRTTTTHTSGGNPSTTTTRSMCVATGGSCAMSSQCCSRYCYLGQCY